MPKKFDFSGYATKNNLKCSDGRTIRKDAFKNNDGQTVPLVWQHVHDDPMNVLGHALLENREDGVYAYCKFNDTDAGKNAKTLVQHGDITALSIYANQLQQNGSDVIHGAIREVSLVLAGANPGALIDNLSIAHADGSYTNADDEAIIYSGLNLSAEEIEHADGDEDKTIADVFNTFTEEQKTVVYALIAQAMEGDADEDTDEDDENVEHADDEDEDDISHSDEGGNVMKKNVFDNNEQNENTNVLSHAQIQTIMADAQKCGSLKDAVLAHAQEYGIQDIDVLFPDAQVLSKDPDWLKREDDWVSIVLNAIHKSPFSRVKSVIANMDFDTARARGYVKANEKKEVFLKAAKRVVTPTTVYVKQKLDRDDILDVTDFDIVAMVRKELRILLDEELARAALIGDGREPDDKDKINEANIIPILKDENLYSIKELLTSGQHDYKALVKEIALSHKRYKGSGAPVFFTTNEYHTNMLWIEDMNGRRIYESDAALCAALGVSKIVEVPQFENIIRTDEFGNQFRLMGIKVNLKDYNFGADKGGQVSSFDDFDIDFNQYKYLMETRCSGALTKPMSAQVYEFPN